MGTGFYSYCIFGIDAGNHMYRHFFIVGAPTKEDACGFFSEELGGPVDPWFVNAITLEEIEKIEATAADCVTWI